MRTSRMDSQNDMFSRANLFESMQSDGLNWDMVISTSADQTVVGPGELVKRWQNKGRNYARFQSESAGKMDFRIISARFATKKVDCNGLDCELFYHPQHTYNIAVFAEALQKAVSWLSRVLGPYPYNELRSNISICIWQKSLPDNGLIFLSRPRMCRGQSC